MRFVSSAAPMGLRGELSPEVIQLIEYIRQELQQIEKAFVDFDYLMLKALHTEPAKPRSGMVVYADGTDWDPGSGEGIYGYYAGAWSKLG